MKKLTDGKSCKKHSSKRGVGFLGAVSLPLIFAFLVCGCSEFTAFATFPAEEKEDQGVVKGNKDDNDAVVETIYETVIVYVGPDGNPIDPNDNGGYSNDSGKNASLPVISLMSLETYTGMPYYKDYLLEDIFGTTYTDGFYSKYEAADGTCLATYRLNREYETFTFTLGVSKADRGNPGTGILRVYADNENIYERTVVCDSDSEFVSLDVSGVKDLTIELYGSTEPQISITGFASLWPCIYDPRLYTAG